MRLSTPLPWGMEKKGEGGKEQERWTWHEQGRQSTAIWGLFLLLVNLVQLLHRRTQLSKL